MPARHVLLACAVALVWGLNFVVVEIGLDSFPPLLFAALRFIVLVMPAIFFIPRPQVGVRWVLLVGLFLSTGQFALLFVGMDQGMPAGLASLVLQVQVVFTTGLAVGLLGERPRAGQLVGAAIAFAGIAVIAAGRTEGIPLLAIVLTIAAAASWGVGNVCTSRAKARNAMSMVIWSALVPPIPLLALSLIFEGPAEIERALTGLDGTGVFALLYVVLGASVFGYGIWTWLLHRHPASSVAPFTLLVPVVGILSAWAVLDERPNAAELAGAAIVLAGLALTMRALRPARRVEVALT